MDYFYPTSSNTTAMNITLFIEDHFNLSKIGIGYLVATAVIFYIAAAMSLFGMVSNGIVIWYLTCCIRRNSFTVYILNLAIADFTFLLVFISVFIIMPLTYKETNISIILIVLPAIFLFGYAISQYLLTAISVERCVSVLFPLWYRCHRPKHQSAIVCAVLWVFSFLTQALEYVFCLAYQTYDIFSVFQSVVICLVFLPLMILSNLFLIIEICRSSRRRHPPRMYVLIIATVFVFLLFSLPMTISVLLFYYDINMFKYVIIPFYLPTINSSLNPVIYFLAGSLRSRQRKCSIVAALKRAFTDKSNSASAQL